MSHSDVERRLIHNKSLLDLIKPTINNTCLKSLLNELEARIEADKRVIVLLSELNKELTTNVLPGAMLAPIFQKLHSACKYLHQVAKEACQGEMWLVDGEKSESHFTFHALYFMSDFLWDFDCLLSSSFGFFMCKKILIIT